MKDRELAEALLADPKENAEHVMLVDLIPVFNSCFQFRQATFFPFGQHLYECQFIFEMIEDNYVFV